MLLFTKLTPPPAPGHYLVRPRLLLALAEGAQRDLTLVVAPPGYGKTSAVTKWLAQRPDGQKVAWLSLDGADNDPVRFWEYVLTAVQRVNPAVGKATLQSLQAVPHPPLETVVNTLINDVWQSHESTGQQTVLILDDYHHITEPTIHELLNQLVDYLPPQALRLIITSRADPPLKLARRRVRQQLCELRAADLRFTAEEIKQFYELSGARTPSERELAQVSQLTEGWPAALQLMFSAGASLSVPETGNRFITDYLLEEVLQQQEETVQTFLLHTAVLPEFSVKLAQTIVPDVGSPVEILGQLEQQNLFLVPLDNKREWFRYHHLFADLLRIEAEHRYGRGYLNGLRETAAEWYAAQQMWPMAIDFTLAAGMIDLAAQYLLTFFEADQSWLAVRQEWLRQLPDTLYDAHPIFYLVKAWLIAADGGTPNKKQLLTAMIERVREVLDAADQKQPFLEAHYAYLRIIVERGHHNTQAQLVADSRAAFAAAPPEAVHARGRLAYYISQLLIGLNQIEQAEQWLQTAQNLLRATNDNYMYVMAHVRQWETQIEAGTSTEKTFNAIRSFVQKSALVQEGHPVTGAVNLVQGTILFYRGELQDAAAQLERGLALIQLTAESTMELTALWNLAFVRFGLGDRSGALALAETLTERIPNFAPQAKILWLWFTLPQHGEDDLITAELDQWYLQNQAGMSALVESGVTTQNFFKLMELFIFVRLLLKRDDHGRFAEALDLLEQQEARLSAPNYWRRRLQVMVHRVMMLNQLKRPDEAADLLADALSMAHHDLHRYTFIEAAPWLLPLLTQLLYNNPDEAWLRSVLTYCQQYGPAPATPAAPHAQSSLIEPLTDRELEVVALLAEGLTNKEIGQQLYLSPNTVRVHTSNIYGKLNVTGRAQAAVRAKELQLIE